MLSKGRIIGRRAKAREEISPMESMVNLVDVMLVFICGLLVSIFIYWNIDAGNLSAVIDRQQLVRVDDPEEVEAAAGSLEGMERQGSAVMDPNTGDIYVVGGDEGDDSTGTQGSAEGSE